MLVERHIKIGSREIFQYVINLYSKFDFNIMFLNSENLTKVSNMLLPLR